MIQFKCRCGNQLSVEDDQAGEGVQCPLCGLLVDVPRLDDLPMLNDDGTYDMGAQNVAPKFRVEQVPSLYESGLDTDRRQSLDDFLDVGVDQADMMQQIEVRPGTPKHPKYDPTTGELILPVNVVEKPKLQVAEVIAPAGPVLGYAHQRPTVNLIPSAWSVYVQLFAVTNLIVWPLVAIAHVINISIIWHGAGFLWAMTFFVPVTMIIAAQLGNVVDSTGPAEHDEVPQMLRSGNLGEDIWRPFVQVMVALVLSLGPAFVASGFGSPWPVTLVLYILGLLALPAVLLTVVCSGTWNNLLPHRILGVIPVVGLNYLLPMIGTLVGFICFVVGTVLVMGASALASEIVFAVSPNTGAQARGTLPGWVMGGIGIVMVFAGVYLLHAAAWQLGILYRRFHDRFPWVLQQFGRSHRTDISRQLRGMSPQQIAERRAQARARKQQAQPAAPIPPAPGTDATRRSPAHR